MTSALLFMSYAGPEENSSGIRTGKLARAAAGAGFRCHIVHGGVESGEGTWLDGVTTTSFRRTDPTRARDARRRSLETLSTAPRRVSWPRVRRALKRAGRTFLQPDEMVLSGKVFARSARRAVAELISEYETVLLVASGPPWSTMLVGRSVKRATGLPLILDYQDLWSLNQVPNRPPLAQARATRWESKMIEIAAGILPYNPGIAQRLRETFPGLRNVPCKVASIGFEGPIPQTITLEGGGTLRLAHFGSIYRDRTLESLLEACLELRARGLDVRLEWYGQLMGEHPLRARLHSFVQGGALVVHDALPLRVAQQRMKEYDILVTVPSPSYAEELTGKLFDYFQAGRPILGLAPQGFLLESLLREAGVGFTVPPDDVPTLIASLGRLASDGGTFRPNLEVLAQHQFPQIGRAIRDLVSEIHGRRVLA